MPNWVKNNKWICVAIIGIAGFFIQQTWAEVDLNTKHRHIGETKFEALERDVGDIKKDSSVIKKDIKELLKRGKP